MMPRESDCYLSALRLFVAAAALVPVSGAAHESVQRAVVRVSITDTTEPLARAWKLAFERAHPGVVIELGRPAPPLAAANADLAAFLRGERELAIVSRELADADQQRWRARYGRAARSLAIARGPWHSFGYLDPVVFIVNDANPLRTIAPAQLEALFSRRTAPDQRPRNWAALGLAGWHGRSIHVTGGAEWNGEPSARGQVVRDRTLHGAVEHGLPASAGLRDDLGADSGREADVPARVAADPLAIGFTGQGHLVAGEHALAIGTGNGAIAPDCRNVASGRYPLARTANLYIGPASRTSRWAQAFVAFIRSPAGQRLVPGARPWLPLHVTARAAGCNPNG